MEILELIAYVLGSKNLYYGHNRPLTLSDRQSDHLIYLLENASPSGLAFNGTSELSEKKIRYDLWPSLSGVDARNSFEAMLRKLNNGLQQQLVGFPFKRVFPDGILVQKEDGWVLSENLRVKMDVLIYQQAYLDALANEENRALWENMMSLLKGQYFGDEFYRENDPYFINRRLDLKETSGIASVRMQLLPANGSR